MSALTVRRKKLPKPGGEKVANKIETCDVKNCTKSGQYEAFFLDYEYDRYFLCTEHKEEHVKIYEEITNRTMD